jgi:hypothetical protein
MTLDHNPRSLELEAPKVFHGKKTWNSPFSPEMAKDSDILDNQGIARRLRTLRYSVTGGDQGAQSRFAIQMKVDPKRWNNYERAYPLPRDMAVHLVRRIPGLTTDWLWLGIEDGLPGRLQRELQEAGNALTLAESRPSTRSATSAGSAAKKSVTRSRA